MRKFILFILTLGLFSNSAYAKHYIITVENNDRAPINWEAFATRAGGALIERFDFINGAVLDFSPEQAKQLASRRVNGMTIEDDSPRNWLQNSDSSFGNIPGELGNAAKQSSKQKAAVPSVSAPKSDRQARYVYMQDQINPKGEFPWSIIRLDLRPIWEKTQGSGVNVGVLDTGINYYHEDLKNNYAGGINCVEPENPFPSDDNGHGTHVAGTIAAVYNSKGVIGVAPKARLYSVKIMDRSGAGAPSNIIKGIEWAIQNKMNVINMSIANPQPSEAMHKAIQAAVANNITVVCAAGNAGREVAYPAAYSETIAVGAFDPNDDYASFSNHGPQIDFAAPGKLVYSTMRKGDYGFMDGTSMACPHITGMAVLAYSLGYTNPASIKAALKAAAVPLKQMTADQQGSGLPLGSRLVQVRYPSGNK